MVADLIIQFWGAFVRAAVGTLAALLPLPPGFVGTAAGYLHEAWLYLWDFSTWLPITFTFTCVGLVLSTWLITLGMELTRMIISYLTLGGGAK